jgi:hypothetical protein
MGGLATVAAAVIAGCAAPVPVRPQGAIVGNQGGAWETVLASPQTTTELAAGPEYARRDTALGYETTDLLTQAGGWPEPYRPSLDQARRLNLPTRGNDILFLSDFAAPGPYWWPRPWYGRTVRIIVP